MRKKLLMLLTLLLPAALLLAGAAPRQVMLYEFGDNGLTQYLHAAEDCPAAWRVMIALDLVQENDLSAPQKDELIQRRALFSGCESEEEALDLLTPALRERAAGALARLSYLRAVVEGKRFPFAAGVSCAYWNDWGQARTFGGDRAHEGIDLMADWGVPVYATGDGVIEKAGWNTLGGWRIGVRGDSDGVYYYYAHLSSYADGVEAGAPVRAGQLLGFVGDTGYGPAGTSGQMDAHLHYGVYEGAVMRAVNPYPLLSRWQKALDK